MTGPTELEDFEVYEVPQSYARYWEEPDVDRLERREAFVHLLYQDMMDRQRGNNNKKRERQLRKLRTESDHL